MVLKRESLSREMRCENGIAFERREDQFGPNSNASMTAWYAHSDNDSMWTVTSVTSVCSYFPQNTPKL